MLFFSINNIGHQGYSLLKTMNGLNPRHETVMFVSVRGKGHWNSVIEMVLWGFYSADSTAYRRKRGWSCRCRRKHYYDCIIKDFTFHSSNQPHSQSICWHWWDQAGLDTWQIQGMNLEIGSKLHLSKEKKQVHSNCTHHLTIVERCMLG